ncbi:hypothetical protein GYMLUDRAFT_62183 [Collybiopsis luxurians FD-317 M1]|uniref:Uncharacterized protein n=1 Tax=Collybiopsis luxurians FD-317 M1 TaxID=944289 RepID=A0A0D0CLS5_9AGAR|nr:hypothetical protein GYMLUDRAFT_62183 [Collybiopsis luxurians FD-317 M1]
MLLAPAAPRVKQHVYNVEPDDEWKENLKAQIQLDLDSMIEDAASQLADNLKKNLEGRSRLQIEFAAALENMCKLATESYTVKLEKERKKRYRAIGLDFPSGLAEITENERQFNWDQIQSGKSSSNDGPASDSPVKLRHHSSPPNRSVPSVSSANTSSLTDSHKLPRRVLSEIESTSEENDKGGWVSSEFGSVFEEKTDEEGQTVNDRHLKSRPIVSSGKSLNCNTRLQGASSVPRASPPCSSRTSPNLFSKPSILPTDNNLAFRRPISPLRIATPPDSEEEIDNEGKSAHNRLSKSKPIVLPRKFLHCATEIDRSLQGTSFADPSGVSRPPLATNSNLVSGHWTAPPDKKLAFSRSLRPFRIATPPTSDDETDEEGDPTNNRDSKLQPIAPSKKSLNPNTGTDRLLQETNSTAVPTVYHPYSSKTFPDLDSECYIAPSDRNFSAQPLRVATPPHSEEETDEEGENAKNRHLKHQSTVPPRKLLNCHTGTDRSLQGTNSISVPRAYHPSSSGTSPNLVSTHTFPLPDKNPALSQPLRKIRIITPPNSEDETEEEGRPASNRHLKSQVDVLPKKSPDCYTGAERSLQGTSSATVPIVPHPNFSRSSPKPGYKEKLRRKRKQKRLQEEVKHRQEAERKEEEEERDTEPVHEAEQKRTYIHNAGQPRHKLYAVQGHPKPSMQSSLFLDIATLMPPTDSRDKKPDSHLDQAFDRPAISILQDILRDPGPALSMENQTWMQRLAASYDETLLQELADLVQSVSDIPSPKRLKLQIIQLSTSTGIRHVFQYIHFPKEFE